MKHDITPMWPYPISRELRRNATTHDGDYRAEKAHSYATARRRRCRRGARFSAENMARVSALIRKRWGGLAQHRHRIRHDGIASPTVALRGRAKHEAAPAFGV